MKDIMINQIAALDQIVHNPARLMIILLLSKNTSLDYLELMETTSLTSGNITTHLSKLAAGGYIKIKKSFKGKKPHTKILLTEAGRSAYVKWANTIALALPESTLDQITSRRLYKGSRFQPENLGYYDFYQTDCQYFGWTQNLLRGFYSPPIPMPTSL